MRSLQEFAAQQAESVAEAQREQFATLTLNTAVELTAAALQRVETSGATDAQAMALRDAMRDSTQADQSRITGYLDKLVQLQRQRVDLIEQEQKDLAQFMTPLQRARYTALQEQVRRRVEQLRRHNGRGLSADTTGAR